MKNNYLLREENGKVFMCCGKAGCPSVSFSEDGLIQITDDFGNSVKMKHEEAKMIKGAVEKLTSENEE